MKMRLNACGLEHSNLKFLSVSLNNNAHFSKPLSVEKNKNRFIENIQ